MVARMGRVTGARNLTNDTTEEMPYADNMAALQKVDHSDTSPMVTPRPTPFFGVDSSRARNHADVDRMGIFTCEREAPTVQTGRRGTGERRGSCRAAWHSTPLRPASASAPVKADQRAGRSGHQRLVGNDANGSHLEYPGITVDGGGHAGRNSRERATCTGHGLWDLTRTADVEPYGDARRRHAENHAHQAWAAVRSGGFSRPG
jgi:hypothetical protein